MTSTIERLNERRKQDEGFTLIELLVVIVILGILAGVVIFAVNGIQDRGQTSACAADRNAMEVAAEAGYAQSDDGSYPASIDDFLQSPSELHTYAQTGGGTGYTVTAIAGEACA